ncbi:MAG: phenylalanine--tRNA ligase subunit beta [Gemmatimonadaceae bacterium]
MLISHDWLRAFVPHGKAPEELRELISAHIATVDAMERLRDDLRPILVARVISVGRHPDSDHLWLTKVDDGSGALLDVVCGAPNVTEGALYPFAGVGTVMPTGNKGGILIERRKIRGVVSNGMLCSAKELGLGDDHEGILALDVDATPGTPLLDVLQVGDVRFDVDVLPNRPDLLSHQGMARDIAAVTGTSLSLPPELGTEPTIVPAMWGPREASSAGVTVRVDDLAGCPRYMGVVIRGVQVGPSPEWLVQRLGSIGARSISNIVDITNYMVHGFGQPMHAFDVTALAGSTIIVRSARAGEKMTTLDGVERTLTGRETLITDRDRAVAIAGVMGGLNSEVTDATADIFLEVAYFDPARTRATRRALGLSTDASYRFERGIDPEGTPRALAVAAQVICALAGGRIDGPPIDVGGPPSRGAPVSLRPARLARLLGATVAADEITSRLTGLGFVVTDSGDDTLLVSAPSWRHDVSRDVDLVEEVARLRGYDSLSDELQPFRPGTVPDHPFHAIARGLRGLLVGWGLAEARPLPFVRGDDATHVRVRNPLADDEPHLRTRVLETLARRAEYNLSRMQGDVRLFEVGSVFAKGEVATGGLPAEEVRVGALVMGARRPPHFTEPKVAHFDPWDARALGEAIARTARPGEVVSLEAVGTGPLWRILSEDGETIGTIERLALDSPAWASDAFGIEVTIGVMPNAQVAPTGTHVVTAASAGDVPLRSTAAATAGKAQEPAAIEATSSANAQVPFKPAATAAVGGWKFKPLPITPAAEFDLALLIPHDLPVARVEQTIRTSAGELLERLTLFDEYHGKELPAGQRSVAWRLTFRDPVRTLRDKEIEGRRQKILRALEGELSVRPRSV